MNSCEGCPSNCCKDFKVTSELIDPIGFNEILKKYPFIHKTGLDVVLSASGREKVVGVYNCSRFNEETQSCIGYDDIPRPDFCINTGAKVIPHGYCKLAKTV